MRYEQFAEKTAQEYQKKGLAEGRSIPEIELYIDQMVSCLNSELSLYAKDGDGPITKGMISNYTKHKMIPGPEGKRYTKDHCIFMLLVYYLKGCFSMDQIQRLMKPLLSNYSSEWDDSLDIQAYYGKRRRYLRDRAAHHDAHHAVQRGTVPCGKTAGRILPGQEKVAARRSLKTRQTAPNPDKLCASGEFPPLALFYARNR